MLKQNAKDNACYRFQLGAATISLTKLCLTEHGRFEIQIRNYKIKTQTTNDSFMKTNASSCVN